MCVFYHSLKLIIKSLVNLISLSYSFKHAYINSFPMCIVLQKVCVVVSAIYKANSPCVICGVLRKKLDLPIFAESTCNYGYLLERAV